MLVDSTALPEQVVDDVVYLSAFMSAGQRCSALRLLFLQEEIADTVLEMIVGAMGELVIGDPSRFDTDLGPLITRAAQEGLNRHIERMRREARIIKACTLGETAAHGSFVAPHLVELESAAELTREEFGPILHVVTLPVRRHPPGARGDTCERIWSHARSADPSGVLLARGVRRHPDRQHLRQPQHDRRGGGRAALRRQRFVRNRTQGRRTALPFALRNERTLTVNTTATGGNAALLNLGT